MKLTDRLFQSLIAFDQFANTLLGSGWADETLSAYSWRTRDTSPWRKRIVDALLFWDRDHCKESYASELERKQLPPEYRIPQDQIPEGYK